MSYITPPPAPALDVRELGPFAIGGVQSILHGLGDGLMLGPMPFLRCVTAEFGYAVGDEVFPFQAYTANAVHGCTLCVTATHLQAIFWSGANAWQAFRKDTNAIVNLTLANWELYVRFIRVEVP